MKIQENQIIGEVVADNYRTASVFKKHKIDFCCNGGRTIGAACVEKQLDPEHLLAELDEVFNSEQQDTIDFRSWPADLLVDYIEKKHHRFVREKVVEIKPFLDKVCRVHGKRHSELFDVQDLFYTGIVDLTQHMAKEENILFPMIRTLVEPQTSNSSENAAGPNSVEGPISVMMHEHDVEGDRFREISRLTNDYTPPADACTTYRVLFSLLQEFEDNLHQHIHLENNILFPKAVALESKMNQVN